jgi:NAD(P)H-nitrite reductase large subunit
VTAVKDQENRVVLDDGTELPYDSLLIAAGSAPFVPKIPGIEGDGVYFFKTLEDADRLGGQIEKAREAVVMGAGFISLEIAEALRLRGLKVTIIGRRKGILLRMLDEEVSGVVCRHVEGRGIRFIGGKTVTAVQRGGRNELKWIMLNGGDIIPCDIFIVASGVRPNIGMLRGSAIRTDEGILVDGHMRTSVPNVYAAGDIAEVEIGGLRKINPIHSNAVRGGWVAGCNIAGREQAVDSHLEDMNVLTLFGLSVLSIGSQKGAESFKRVAGRTVAKAYAGEDGLLRGVQLVGDVAKGGLYLSIMRRGIPVRNLDILDPRLNYGQTLSVVAT